MANRATNSNPFCAARRKKFNLNLRSQRQIREGKQAHPDLAEINTEGIHVGRSGEYLHGGIQPLAFPATPVRFEGSFENHLVRQ